MKIVIGVLLLLAVLWAIWDAAYFEHDDDWTLPPPWDDEDR